MQLAGKHIVKTGAKALWILLMDTDTLARIVPGISRLEKTGDNRFISYIHIKLGLINAHFSGELQLEDLDEPNGFTLSIQQSASVGKASAAIRINLLPVNEGETEISFNGEVKLAGLLAGMGQRVLGGVSNIIIRDFFDNLDKEVAKETTQ